MGFIKKHKWTILSLIIVFLVTLTFPYTGDDIEWSLTKVSPHLLSDFAHNVGLNGRYLGNLFVVFMTKSKIIRGIIMSTVLVTIVSIIKKETKISSLVVWLLLLLMPLRMLRQSIVWTSGFTNYVISTAFLLGILSLLKKCFKEDNLKLGLLNAILIFLGSLFIENITVFLIILTITLNIIYYIKNKKINKSLILAFVGSVVGAITMFSHPVYTRVADGTDNYRGYANSIINLIMVPALNFINIISYNISFSSVAIIILITVLLTIYYKQTKENLNEKQAKILTKIFNYMYFYCIYIFISRLHYDWGILGSYAKYFDAIVTIIYIIALITSIIILFYKSKKFIDILSVLLTIIGLAAPLFLVNPIGPRNFFMIYVLEIILVCYILKETKMDYKKYSKLMIFTIIVLCINYSTIYIYITDFMNKRDEYIQYKSSNSTDTEIIVPKLEYPSYVWSADFDSEYRTNVHIKKYNLREDITFKFVEYSDWKKHIKKEGYNK